MLGAEEAPAIAERSHPEPLTEPAAVAETASAVRRSGRLYFDLEFVSEGRYVPELGLVQVAWGEPQDPRIALVDPLAVDAGPVFDLIGDPAVETVVHSGQGDLALLAYRHGVAARAVADTQIAAALLGLGEQPGYAALVERTAGVALDKSAQFTAWTRRPLAAEQLRYAADDVRFLPAVWSDLAAQLAARGRTEWLAEESAAMASAAARRTPPEEAFRRLKGWDRLAPRSLGALVEAAAWRERTALATNLPPRWIVQDGPLVQAARRLPRTESDLEAIQGIGRATARRWGAPLLAALEAGAAHPRPRPEPLAPLPPAARDLLARLAALVEERCRAAEVSPRLVASRGDLENLVRRLVAGSPGGPAAEPLAPETPLLTGWRREVAGEAVLVLLGFSG